MTSNGSSGLLGHEEEGDEEEGLAGSALLERVRDAVLSVCGMDFRIEDDVLVAGSGMMTTIRTILMEDHELSPTCLALFRLIVSRFMPPLQQVNADTDKYSSMNHSVLATLNTAVQPHVISILRELVTKRLPVPTLSTKLPSPPTLPSSPSTSSSLQKSKSKSSQLLFDYPMPLSEPKCQDSNKTMISGVIFFHFVNSFGHS